MYQNKSHPINDKQHIQNHNCKCGKDCVSCDAERLSVSCGCDMESKQYEYSLEKKLTHKHHMKGEHDAHNISKLSHLDHEAAMTNPQVAKQMETDMRNRFWISFVLSI